MSRISWKPQTATSHEKKVGFSVYSLFCRFTETDWTWLNFTELNQILSFFTKFSVCVALLYFYWINDLIMLDSMKIEKCFETDEIFSKSMFLFHVARANHEVDKSACRLVGRSVTVIAFSIIFKVI